MQYPSGTFETPAGTAESPAVGMSMSINANGSYRRGACIGSCKHKIWEAVRASSAAPYYLDDFADGKINNVFLLLLSIYVTWTPTKTKTLFCTYPIADVYRWQDGAIVANNPTIFAIREAQLLWPDARIDCLVSIGCGSVPAKVITFICLHTLDF